MSAASFPVSLTMFASYLNCKTKYVLSKKEVPEPPAFFSQTAERILEAYRAKAAAALRMGANNVLLPFTSIPYTTEDPRQCICSVDCHAAVYNPRPGPHSSQLAAISFPKDQCTYLPLIYSPHERVTASDRIVLGFAALAVSEVTGRVPDLGWICHGELPRVKQVKLAIYLSQASRILDQIWGLESAEPPLVLNKHCSECDFQARCRERAISSDDLSLVSPLSEKERRKLNEKGVFTITQLSYGYRPRRRRRAKLTNVNSNKHPVRHDPKLKALAIKKAQIHVVGTPVIPTGGTPVYIDVEGIPDRDTYYLIGLRYKQDNEYMERSFWANDCKGEQEMWRECLLALRSIKEPRLVHYGSYEAKFLNKMQQRYRELSHGVDQPDVTFQSTINLASLLYARIYFPTYTNSLKEIARYLGFDWSQPGASGAKALYWRAEWELFHESSLKQMLIEYNLEDCRAAELVYEALQQLCTRREETTSFNLNSVDVGSLEVGFQRTFGKFASALPDFERINKAAYWDYQRSKVYVRSGNSNKRSGTNRGKWRCETTVPIDKEVRIENDKPSSCWNCGSATIWKGRNARTQVVIDLKFTTKGSKRHVVRYLYRTYRCGVCKAEKTFRPAPSKLGPGLCAYVVYLIIELRLSHHQVSDFLRTLFKINVKVHSIAQIKLSMAAKYEATYKSILHEIRTGALVHADETKGVVYGGGHYVWIFTNLKSVAYVYSPSRDASILEDVLKDFQGVLVSDFYGAYDSIGCAQQKCLIHSLRDINEDILKNPYNDELSQIASQFGSLLRRIVETVDRYGLKAWHLRKHKREAEAFLQQTRARDCRSEVALGLQKRLEKNVNKLFTFLDHDDVPWNNNNAEHAVRAFTRLRNVMVTSTANGTRDYATLLSIQQTLKYRGKSFLEFLRSGNVNLA
ncbi:IS66 family transposase [Microvirga tunisiensis]|uniref:IS66 family transposase n=1 Tax=Microvirga tunisiensis TaxID=2108360 RepID=A0A5N7MV13_9HYPH|nr:IS66 family transposase [Microvirga tunisiensis]MPR12797.1 IS66 family transposase [Microvirga tunisiensis]MPR30728.1 IS66 family transposase [Microvirga tunisiensis]